MSSADNNVDTQCQAYLTDWVAKLRFGSQKPIAPFLEKMPAEVRLKIWEFYISSVKFHVRATREYRWEKPKFRFTACGGTSSLDATGMNDKQLSTPAHSSCKCSADSIRGKGSALRGALALLRVCKVIHMEVMDVIYGAATFAFNYPNALHEFHSALPLVNFKAIRYIHLTISCMRPFDPQAMNRAKQDVPVAMKALQALPNLQRLELYVQNLDQNIAARSIDPNHPMLEPLVLSALWLWGKFEIAGEIEVFLPLWYKDRYGVISLTVNDRAATRLNIQLCQVSAEGHTAWKLTLWENLPQAFWTRVNEGSIAAVIKRD